MIAAVVVIAAVIMGRSGHTSGRDARFDAGAPVLAPTAPAHTSSTPSGGAAAHTTTAPGPSAQGSRPAVSTAEVHLQSALGRALRLAGPGTGALVYDLSTHTELFALQPLVRRPPASVEKLWTTTALLLRLGPTATMHTDVLGTGTLGGGIWHGNLYLRGGGDPTFGDPTFNRVWNQGYGSTAAGLVSQLAARGIHRVTGHVFADESLFDRKRGGLLTDQLPDIPDLGGQLSALTYDHGTTVKHYSPATFAARELALTMHDSGIAVRAARTDATTPPGAGLLATVSSPPLSVMTRLMDVPSDDLFAELFTKQLGARFGSGGSIAAGARVIAQAMADTYGLHPRIRDGSGLSRTDGSSPLEIIDLLREVWHTPVGRELVDSLPTVGVSGTVAGIGLKTPASGRCVAKTGTLTDVSNLAGYCSARGHQALAFALFVDGPTNEIALALESRMVGAIAAY